MNFFRMFCLVLMMPYTRFISRQPLVTILMGLYNGARHLPHQLASISRQSHKNWHLICYDDGSSDHTRRIVRDFAKNHIGKVQLRYGPQAGFAANYMTMIRSLDAESGFVCFADQDDIWLPDKIARGLETIGKSSPEPTLYAGRRYAWHPPIKRLVATPGVIREPSFRNALVENIAPGNTILLNPAATELAHRASHRVTRVFAHDWWLYLLLTGTGGQVIFDNAEPQILYRQHDKNIIGAGSGIPAQLHRKKGVLQGLLSERLTSNLDALYQTEDMLTDRALHTLNQFKSARVSRGFDWLSGMCAVGPYRQTRRGTLGFWGASSLGRA